MNSAARLGPRSRASVVVLAALLALTGCGGSDSDAPEPRERTVDVLAVAAGATIARCDPLDDAFTEGKVEIVAVPVGELRDGATSDVAPFSGQVAQRTIPAGEQLTPEDVEPRTLAIPEGRVAVSLRFPTVAGPPADLGTGDRLRVSARFEGRKRVLAGQALVLAASCGEPALITLALTRRQAVEVMAAESLGELHFQRTPATSPGGS